MRNSRAGLCPPNIWVALSQNIHWLNGTMSREQRRIHAIPSPLQGPPHEVHVVWAASIGMQQNNTGISALVFEWLRFTKDHDGFHPLWQAWLGGQVEIQSLGEKVRYCGEKTVVGLVYWRIKSALSYG